MLRQDLDNSPIRFTWRLALALCLPTLLAVVTLWPVLDGTHLADDYNLNFNLDKQAPGIEVLWHETWAEFSRPFLDAKGWPYFRPLASLSIAIMLEIFGNDPVALHALNLFHHATITFLTALICALYGRRHAEYAALVGGAFIAVHPAAVEPVAWWSAYTSSQAAFWATLACAAFALHRHFGYRLQYRLCMVFAALALLSKETATALPFALLGLDLLFPGPLRWRSVLRRQLGFAPLWILYVVARTSALDGFLSGHDALVEQQLWDQPSIMGTKFRALLFPFGVLNSLWFGIPTLLFGGMVLVQATRSKRQLGVLLGFAAWLACMFAPSFTHQVAANLGGSRVTYVALPTAALAISYLAFGEGQLLGRKPSFRLLGITLGLAIACCLAQVQSVCLDNYRLNWAESARFARDLRAQGLSATLEKPLALVTTPHSKNNAPLILPTMISSSLEKPYAQSDIPYVDLTVSHTNPIAPKGLEWDASPVRAMYKFGALICDYLPEHDVVVQQRIPFYDPSARLPDLVEEAPGYLKFTTPVSSLQIEGLELQISGGYATSGTLTWRTDFSQNAAYQNLPAAFRGIDFTIDNYPDPAGTTTFTIDLSHSVFFLDLYRSSQVLGFDLTWPDDLTEITVATALDRIADLELSSPLRGRAVTLGNEDIRSPIASHHGDLRCVLLTPIHSIDFPVEQDHSITFPERAVTLLESVLHLNRQRTVYYYFESGKDVASGAEASRSEVDWFTITRTQK